MRSLPERIAARFPEMIRDLLDAEDRLRAIGETDADMSFDATLADAVDDVVDAFPDELDDVNPDEILELIGHAVGVVRETDHVAKHGHAPAPAEPLAAHACTCGSADPSDHWSGCPWVPGAPRAKYLTVRRAQRLDVGREDAR